MNHKLVLYANCYIVIALSIVGIVMNAQAENEQPMLYIDSNQTSEYIGSYIAMAICILIALLGLYVTYKSKLVYMY
jgi:hypothetical protein